MARSPLEKLIATPTHHAHLVLGNTGENFELGRHVVRGHVEEGTIELADVWSRHFEVIGIEDAREIKEIQNNKPVGERRFVLIALSSIQTEAQNSLLKLFEEPHRFNQFFIFAPDTNIFLPTLLSRFDIVDLRTGESEAEHDTLVSKFLKSNIAERMSLLEPIIKEKDKTGAEHFLDALESSLYRDRAKLATNVPVFDDIFSARRFVRSRSPSVKMILENLAGTVPVLRKEVIK